jgi:hypothetical protein
MSVAMSAKAFWSPGGRPTETDGRPGGANPVGSPSQGKLTAEDLFGARAAGAPAAAPPTSADLQPPTAQTFQELDIPDSFRQAVEKELSSDEKLLWVGRQSRNPQLHAPHPFLPYFGVGLLVLAGIAAGVGLGTGHLFGCVFAGFLGLIGVVVLVVPRFNKAHQLCRYCYVVTNRRAMLVEKTLWQRGGGVQSYLPHQLLGMVRENHETVPGAGDLVFEYIMALPGQSFDGRAGSLLQRNTNPGLSSAPQRVPRGFLCIDQVHEVEVLIRTTLLRQLEQTLDAPKAAPLAHGTAPRSPSQALAAPAPEAPVAPAPASFREDGAVPAELKARMLSGLDSNEKPVWVGQPVAQLVFLRNIGYLAVGGFGMVAALIWLVISLIPATPAAPRPQPGKKGVVAAPPKQQSTNPVIPIGLFVVSAGVSAVTLARWWSATRTCYGLTNRRALVYKQGLFGPTRESYSPLEVSAVRRRNSWLGGGKGDLIFRTVQVITTSRNQTTGRSSTSVRTIHYGFLAIAKVDEVDRLLHETLIDRFVDKLSQANAL